jgi:sec-independent protein translocase protein TatC
MHYISHYFVEIRLRFLYSIFACLLSFTLSYFYQCELFYLLTKPFLYFSKHFIFFELTEGLYTMIRISGIISLFTVMPYIFYHIWSFTIPSYYIFERQILKSFLYLFVILFILEFFFVYSIFFPKFCEFLISFEIKPRTLGTFSIELTPRIASYVKIIIEFFSFILFIFQLPFLFIGLFVKNYINSWHLCEYRKLIFFLCIILSAFLSPPELISQVFLSVLLYCIFEVILFFGFFFQRPFHGLYLRYQGNHRCNS